MIETTLTSIIERLDAMAKDQTDDVQKRVFEKNRKVVCIVYYNKLTGIYTVKRYPTDKGYRFDNLDYAAIEIFELLAPRKSNRTTQ